MKRALISLLIVGVMITTPVPVSAIESPCPYNAGGVHEWMFLHTDPSTCAIEGHKSYECINCGDVKIVDLPLKKHKWSKPELIEDPSRDDTLIYGQMCMGDRDCCDEIKYTPIKIKKKKQKRIWSKAYYKKVRKLSDGKIKWTSSKKKVATVSKKGVVKARKKGTTILKAKVTVKKYRVNVYIKYKIVVK